MLSAWKFEDSKVSEEYAFYSCMFFMHKFLYTTNKRNLISHSSSIQKISLKSFTKSGTQKYPGFKAFMKKRVNLRIAWPSLRMNDRTRQMTYQHWSNAMSIRRKVWQKSLQKWMKWMLNSTVLHLVKTSLIFWPFLSSSLVLVYVFY